MEILAFFLIATVLVLGWFAGSKFVCVFLSIPTVLLGLLSGGGPWAWGCIAFLIAIWGPFYYRRRLTPVYPPLIQHRPAMSKYEREWREFGARH